VSGKLECRERVSSVVFLGEDSTVLPSQHYAKGDRSWSVQQTTVVSTRAGRGNKVTKHRNIKAVQEHFKQPTKSSVSQNARRSDAFSQTQTGDGPARVSRVSNSGNSFSSTSSIADGNLPLFRTILLLAPGRRAC